jgi:L-threonine kinase
MRVVVLDFGGEVDTLEFNSTERDGDLKRLEPRMAEAVSLIETGMRKGDISLIGRGATASSTANQEILFNPNLESVLELSNETGAVGVNVAHSGTVIGMLFPDDVSIAENASVLACRRFRLLESVMQRRVTGGGVRLI